MGTLSLANLAVAGQVSIITRPVTTMLNFAACDARRYSEQPQKYGVNVYQGALTVYNFRDNSKARIRASLANIAVGSKHAPVLGSGIFASGYGDTGGRVELETLMTGEIHSTGALPMAPRI